MKDNQRRITLDWWTVIVGTALAALVLAGLPARMVKFDLFGTFGMRAARCQRARLHVPRVRDLHLFRGPAVRARRDRGDSDDERGVVVAEAEGGETCHSQPRSGRVED